MFPVMKLVHALSFISVLERVFMKASEINKTFAYLSAQKEKEEQILAYFLLYGASLRLNTILQ